MLKTIWNAKETNELENQFRMKELDMQFQMQKLQIKPIQDEPE